MEYLGLVDQCSRRRRVTIIISSSMVVTFSAVVIKLVREPWVPAESGYDMCSVTASQQASARPWEVDKHPDISLPWVLACSFGEDLLGLLVLST